MRLVNAESTRSFQFTARLTTAPVGDFKEGLINSSETVGGFRGASEDAVAPNGLCPPELLISVSLGNGRTACTVLPFRYSAECV